MCDGLDAAAAGGASAAESLFFVFGRVGRWAGFSLPLVCISYACLLRFGAGSSFPRGCVLGGETVGRAVREGEGKKRAARMLAL